MPDPAIEALDGASAVVVSHNRQIGRACAAELVGSGREVVLLEMGPAEALEDLDEVRTVSVPETSEIGAALAEVAERSGPIAVLVTVPGQSIPASAPRSADQVLDQELLSVERSLRQVVPSMVEHGWGRVVLLAEATSLTDRVGWDDGRGAAMWGLVGLARTVGREAAARGVSVNVVRTTVVDRPELQEARAESAELDAELDDLAAKTPTRRLADLDDVAAAVGFLASDEASYVTGIVLPVDGGRTIGLGV